MRLVIDTRPVCESEGDYLGDPVPCDHHDGHRGRHRWTKPMTFEEYEWTTKQPKVRRVP